MHKPDQFIINFEMSNRIIWKVKTFDELQIDELYKILQARIEVFVLEQNCVYPDLDGLDQKAIHLWAEEDSKILAYCRIFDRGIKYEECSLGRVLTTRLGRGRKLGKQLLRFATSIIEIRYNSEEVRISAQDYLLKFYSEFGFVASAKKYLEDGIPHTQMFRKGKKNSIT